MSEAERTLDGFLGGRLTIAQPKRGFRAGHDTVLLAAAVPAGRASRVLELGSGAGVAALCLAARVPDVDVLGIERDGGLVELARDNAARNGVTERVHFETGDVLRIGGRSGAFDHVFFNPPFYPSTGQESPHATRDRAMRDADEAITGWMRAALMAAKDGGTVTAIVRADRASELLSAAGGLTAILFPLLPHACEEPKRAIVRVVKGTKGPLRKAAGLVLHEANGRNTEAAEAVLRHGAALKLD